jgi:YggT family protein
MFPMAMLSWFRIEPGTTLARVRYYLYRATEPVLRPVRRIIPPMGGIDISFIVVFLGIQLIVIPVLLR